MDESTDASNRAQLSTVFRYVSPEGEIQERFLRFTDVSTDRSAVSLSKYLFNILQEFQCGDKLVAQTFDGAAVMSGQHSGLQKLVRDKYDQAIFVHCYGHRLNLVLQQSVNHIKQCKIFFKTLSGLAAFFFKIPQKGCCP